MNKEWDSDKGGRDSWINWIQNVFTEALRVLKPGAHALVWALPRTSHWTAFALENAGFEIRDVVHHLFGSGFPKALDISKAIDKEFNLEREIVGIGKRNMMTEGKNDYGKWDESGIFNITSPASPEAQQWDGWKTALKPAVENWILCRKPLNEKTVAQNVLKYGTGGLNVKECAISNINYTNGGKNKGIAFGYGDGITLNKRNNGEQGRFPSNLILDGSECVVREFPMTDGISKGGNSTSTGNPTVKFSGTDENMRGVPCGFGDSGSAARFFYQAKPSPAERNAGLEGFEKKLIEFGNMPSNGVHGQTGKPNKPIISTNHHPTVKSIALMEYLIKLITPPNGTILDCFMGSGSTGCAAAKLGFNFVGIEKEKEYFYIAKARIEFWKNYTEPEISGEGIETTKAKILQAKSQLNLFTV